MLEKLVPDTFLKKSNLSTSLDQQLKVLHTLFLLYVQIGSYQNILKEGAGHLLLSHMKFFFFKKNKTKRVLKLVSLPYFLHDF